MLSPDRYCPYCRRPYISKREYENSDCYIHEWHAHIDAVGRKPRKPKPQLWDACFIGTREKYTDRVTTIRKGETTIK